MAFTGRSLRSTIDENGKLTISLDKLELDAPGDDEVIIRVEATPINPSDLGILLGLADPTTLQPTDEGLTFDVPKGVLPRLKNRIKKRIPVGNEGAGTVVAAGRNASALEGKTVGIIGGAMYADYRNAKASEVVPLPEGTAAADGASMFVNPLTALGFVETARIEGHKAIVHTAAASNLGQMLQKICLDDGIPLINIVRSQAQEDILREIGAVHVLNSKDDDFKERLTDVIAETGATIAFDPIGGGSLGSDILAAMERAAARNMTHYSVYGSDTFKQLYIYGALDRSPTVLNRMGYGFVWSVSGWLLFPFLQKTGGDVRQRLQKRVIAELTTTFASHYTKVIGLNDVLDPKIFSAYARMSTGEKYLIDPTRG